MSYVGNTNTTQAFTPAVDYFSGNGSTVAFTLSRPVASVAQVQAVVNNVPQNPTDAFTVLNNTITFTSAPSSGTNNIYVQYTSPITQIIQPGQGTVGSTQLATGAVTTAKLSSSTGTGAVALASLPTFTTTIGVGGATPSASGSGITFPASQSASTDANTLDDYEEGTWTVVDTSGAGLSISSYMAQYVKIGRFVMAQFDINYPGTSNTNSAQFSLPFANNNAYSSGYFGYTTFGVGTTQYGPGMIVNDSSVNARVMSGGGQLTNAVCSGTRLMGTVCYYTT